MNNVKIIFPMEYVWGLRPLEAIAFFLLLQIVNSEHLLDLSAGFLGLHLRSRDQHGTCSMGLLPFSLLA